MAGRIFALLVATLALAGGAVPAGTAAASERPVVAASIYPVADLLSRVGGDDFKVQSLFGPGVHPRQPQTKRIALPEELLLYVRVGGSFEGAADNKAAAQAGQVLNLSTAIELIGEEAAVQVERKILAAALGADTSTSGRVNPWFWLDPLKAGEAADLMAAALAEIRPEAAGRVEKRTKLLKEELRQLDKEISAGLAQARDVPFAVFTSSWSYFARHYGLTEVHLASVIPGGGPGRHSLKGASAVLRRTGAGRAYTDLTFPASPARAVAARAGAKLIVLHPLGIATTGDGGYFSLLREAARAVAGGPL